MKNKNGSGTVRKLENGLYECIIQSNLINYELMEKKLREGNKDAKPTYKRIKRIRPTREEAEKAAKQALKAWEKKTKNMEEYKMSKSMTFGEYCKDYLENVVKRDVTAGTYYTYTKQFNQFVDKYSISKYQTHQLTKKLFENYYERLSEKYAPKTIVFPVQLCKRVCEWLVTRSILEENYAAQAKVIYEKVDEFKFVEKKKHKEIFTEEDLRKFYVAYENDITEYAAIVVLMLETGLRPQEFANIQNCDISLEDRVLHISKSSARRFVDDSETVTEIYTKSTKTGTERDIRLSDLACDVIRKMQYKTKMNCKYNPNDLLYPTFKNGRVRTNATMEAGFKLLCEKLEIDRDVHPTRAGQMRGLNIYALRHTCDTLMHVNGANPVITAAMLGHSPTTSLQYYTHVTVDMQDEVKTPFQTIQVDNNMQSEITEEDEIRLLKKLMEKYKDKL